MEAATEVHSLATSIYGALLELFPAHARKRMHLSKGRPHGPGGWQVRDTGEMMAQRAQAGYRREGARPEPSIGRAAMIRGWGKCARLCWAYAGPMLGLYSVRWAASGGPTWVHLPTCHLQPLTDRSWVPSNSIPVFAIPCRPCLENISAPSVDSSQSGAGIDETSQVQDEVGSRHRALQYSDCFVLPEPCAGKIEGVGTKLYLCQVTTRGEYSFL